jgi:phosphoglucomutase
MNIPQNILDRLNPWLSDAFDKQTQEAVETLLTSSPDELADAFYKDLEFGTGGMRGVVGVGTNRINKYTLGKSTQGLSNYLKKVFPSETLKVAIAYDCRNDSKALAKVVSEVLSANHIQVYLYSDLRPTPMLSFAVKHLNCHAGIVLTASHNPPEYNGYKVYWQDGGQIVPPQDGEIIAEIDALTYQDIKFEPQPALITLVDHDLDEAFFESTLNIAKLDIDNQAREQLKITFTSLHGTSIMAVPEVLKRAGYKDVSVVEEQAKPDGNFPTVKSPNPEEPEALEMAIQLANEVGSDIVVGTDPDCDRLGVAARHANGDMMLLNGNQTMVIMTAFLLEKWKKEGKIVGNEFIGSTIVSTPMMLELATAYGVECKVGLTGFKWIAKMIKDFPEQTFIGGGEESFGYMVGDAVRDKDAVAATLLICEIAAYLKENGSSLFEELLRLYTTFGFYKEELISLTKKGMDGAEQIKQMMIDLRQNPKETINGQRVVMIEDYQNSTAKNQLTGELEELNIPKSNVLIYYLEDGTKICARPSGTEPKIKFYFSVNENLDDVTQFENVNKQLDQKIQNIIQEMDL